MVKQDENTVVQPLKKEAVDEISSDLTHEEVRKALEADIKQEPTPISFTIEVAAMNELATCIEQLIPQKYVKQAIYNLLNDISIPNFVAKAPTGLNNSPNNNEENK